MTTATIQYPTTLNNCQVSGVQHLKLYQSIVQLWPLKQYQVSNTEVITIKYLASV